MKAFFPLLMLSLLPVALAGWFNNPKGCGGTCDVDLTFCGNDGNCHSYDCENVYRFGTKQATGLDPGSSKADDLVCSTFKEVPNEDFLPEDLDFGRTCGGRYLGGNLVLPLAMYFPCKPTGELLPLGCPTEDLQGFYLSYQRVCNGEPQPGLSFVCYDMQTDDMADKLSQYAEKTKTRLATDCTNIDRIPIEYHDEYSKNETFNASHYFESHFIGETDSDSSHSKRNTDWDFDLASSMVKSELKASTATSAAMGSLKLLQVSSVVFVSILPFVI